MPNERQNAFLQRNSAESDDNVGHKSHLYATVSAPYTFTACTEEQ